MYLRYIVTQIATPMINKQFLNELGNIYNLSEAQVQVLTLIVNSSIDEVAKELGISPDAVRARMGEIYSKFEIKGAGPGKFKRLQYKLQKLSENPDLLTVMTENLILSMEKKLDTENKSEEDWEKVIYQDGCLLRIEGENYPEKIKLMSKILNNAKDQKYRTVDLRLDDTDINDRENLDNFLKWFCIAINIDLTIPMEEIKVDEHWQKSMGNSKLKCTSYFQEYLLKNDKPLILALKDLDVIYKYEKVVVDFLGMLRTWHENAKTKEIWKKLRLVLVHKDKYPILETDLSPFNLGDPKHIINDTKIYYNSAND